MRTLPSSSQGLSSAERFAEARVGHYSENQKCLRKEMQAFAYVTADACSSLQLASATATDFGLWAPEQKSVAKHKLPAKVSLGQDSCRGNLGSIRSVR
jgi:hypothetical protein